MTIEEVRCMQREAERWKYGPETLSGILSMYRNYELAARHGLPDGPRFADAVHWQQCADECELLISRQT